jgi:hypothetical protein
MNDWVEQEVLIVGKTYPTPHKRFLDTVCTGGITRDGQWIRLFPISFRYLDREQQYTTFSWLRLNVKKNPRDQRHESHLPDEKTIEVVGHESDWAERKRILQPLLAPHMEALQKQNKADWKSVSMGLVEVEYIDFHWKETDREWNENQKKYMTENELWGPRRLPLQKMPYDLMLKFKCKGNPGCKKHDMTLFVWEYNQTFRSWLKQRRYGNEAGVLAKMKEAMKEKVFNPKNETYLLVGTLHQHPQSWIIGGVFFPPKGIPIPGVLF